MMSGLISKCTTLKAGKLSRVVEIENYNIKLNPRERMFVVVVNADPSAIVPGQPEPTGKVDWRDENVSVGSLLGIPSKSHGDS